MMEFNYLLEQRALNRAADGKYAIDYKRMPAAIAQLAKELLEMEATGGRNRVEAWFTKYDKMPDDLKAALAATTAIPVDVEPVFSFPDLG
jgi:hypothetical protein